MRKMDVMTCSKLVDRIHRDTWDVRLEKIKNHRLFGTVVYALKLIPEKSTAWLIDQLETWMESFYSIEALALLPEVTGENPVPAWARGEMMLMAQYWTQWATKKLQKQLFFRCNTCHQSYSPQLFEGEEKKCCGQRLQFVWPWNQKDRPAIETYDRDFGSVIRRGVSSGEYVYKGTV